MVSGVDAKVSEARRSEGVDRGGSDILHTEDVKEGKGVEGGVVGFSGEDAGELEQSVVEGTMVNAVLEFGEVIQNGAARGAAGDRSMEEEKEEKSLLIGKRI